MKKTVLFSAAFLLCCVVMTPAQNPAMPYLAPSNDLAAVLAELRKISQSVDSASQGIAAMAAKSESSRGAFADKQQRLMMGMDLLVKSEQRVATFQKLQIDLVEKLNEHRNKIAQIDLELRPQRIDRSLAFEGTTETEELRENRRLKLRTERTSLTTLINQIQTTLNETADGLNEAQAQTYRLRRSILPAIERELIDQ